MCVCNITIVLEIDLNHNHNQHLLGKLFTGLQCLAQLSSVFGMVCLIVGNNLRYIQQNPIALA